MTFNLYNLETSEITALASNLGDSNLGDSNSNHDRHPQLAPTQILLLPSESPADLHHLHLAYQKEFPTTTRHLTKLRTIALLADWNHRRAQTNLQQFLLEAHSAGLPLHAWRPEALQKLALMQRLQSQAEQNYTRALQSLQSAPVPEPAKPEPAKPEPAPPPQKREPVRITQNILVETIDGEIKVTNHLPAADVLFKQPWPENSVFSRDFYFPNALVPEPYQWVLTHDGVTHPPTRSVSIFYSHPEFLRLAKLELDTQSPIVLDGQRLHVTRRE